ncbi:MAG: hypothetical protein ACJAW3_000033 [Lentimonas sp.]|jgi:uncharacterized protein YggE
MKDNNIFLKFTVSLLLLCFVVTSFCFATLAIQSGNKTSKPKSNITITAIGEAEVESVPDIAHINLTIEDQDLETALAQEKINNKAKKLAVKLEKMGIDEKDIVSTSYQVAPKYESVIQECRKDYCPSKYKIVGYKASQQIKIKIRKIDLTGKVVSAIGKIGINKISGPNFEVSDDEKFKSQARILAIKNAKHKAIEIAQALEMELGEIVKFNENNNNLYQRRAPMAMSKMASFDDQESEPAKLFNGEKIIKSKVTIIYSLK